MADELKEYQKWILKADADLKIILKDIKTEDPVTEIICYHAQQTAEKYLKAYLVFKNQIPEKTHLIERLIDTCIKFDSEFEKLMQATELTEYAVGVRYPDDFFTPDIEEAKRAIELAILVKDFVLSKLASC